MNNCPNCNKKLSIFKIGLVYIADGKRFCSIKCKKAYLDSRLLKWHLGQRYKQI